MTAQDRMSTSFREQSLYYDRTTLASPSRDERPRYARASQLVRA